MTKVLLVEDDEMLGTILQDQLEMNDYEVSLLRLPNETVDRLLKDQFDIVIMDKLLKGIDGTQICTTIRRTEGISNIPILMMSGYDGAKEVCIAAGASNFIAKPFSVDSFLENIESTLSKERDLKD